MNAHSAGDGLSRLLVAVGLRRAPREEPSEALFRAIRWKLVLWYSGVLAVALALGSLILYLAVQRSLLSPVEDLLHQNARSLATSWAEVTDQYGPGVVPCLSERFASPDTLYACYDVHGNLIGESRIMTHLPSDLTSPSLVHSAVEHGNAIDSMNTPLGSVERYALRVETQSGQTVGVVLVFTSIGDQVQALETLRHWLLILSLLTLFSAFAGGLLLANRALLPVRIAYKRQRDFIADASHELRTPLTILRSNIEVVLRGRSHLPPDDVLLLEDTVQEAEHLTTMANAMLDLARLDSEAIHLEREVVDLTELGEEVARWSSPLGRESGVTVTAAEGPRVLLLGDQTLLQQAIMSLVENAIKYNRPGGEVSIAVGLQGSMATVTVRDTGIGIAPEHLAHLGERFYRVDKARSRESGGAGLGLSLVRRIASSHGGTFRIESEYGTGTAAILTLPGVLKDLPAPEEPVPERKGA